MAEPFWYETANKARLGVRRDMADALDEYAKWLAGTHLDKPGGPHHEARGEHREISRTMTEALNRSGLPPEAAAGVSELGGYANEGITGTLQAILAASDVVKGRPVTHSILSPSGWDQADIDENREGQQDALSGPDLRPGWLKALAGATQGDAPMVARRLGGLGLELGDEALRRSGVSSKIGRLLEKLR